jgi:LmbE family N-acetylglucosaminyl deacetylase
MDYRRLINSFFKLMGLCVLIFIILYSLLYGYYIQRTRCNTVAGSQNILIFAPHPDDGVIMAAGYAMQTRKNGGKVKVAYLTGNHQRLREAQNAWKLIGLAEEDLIRLKIDINDRLFKENINEKVKYLEMVIDDIQPQIIFIPLYEGGHFEHDLTNYLVSRAVKPFGQQMALYV